MDALNGHNPKRARTTRDRRLRPMKLVGIALVLVGISFTTSVAITRWLVDRPPIASPVVTNVFPSAELNGRSTACDLGVVPAGGSKSICVRFINPTTEPLMIHRIDTSCECLRVEFPRRIFAGHEEITATATVDLSGQPRYRGNLILTADGVAADVRRLFALTIDVGVR